MNTAQAIDSIVKLLGLSFKKEKFATTFLEDGTEVTNNMDDDAMLEIGQTLYVVKESTLVPAPEGTHKTREGMMVTVDGESTIISIATEEKNETDVNNGDVKEDVEEEVEDEKEMDMTVAEDAQGKKLESPTFDVGEEVYEITESGEKVKPADGEYQVVLKDESGNENKIRIMVEDGKITGRENVEGESMNSQFSKDLEDIKTSITQLIELVGSMNGKFKTELNSLKTDFETFKKSPERTPVDEKKTYTESFSDYKLNVIKSLRR